jgi:tetratricopeptide (TPR) repeat protein
MKVRILLVALMLALLGNAALAQRGGGDGEKETKETPAMREKVYTLLSEAQTLLEEENDSAGALQKLGQLQKMRDLNSYELAQMWTFYGYLYFNQENYEGAKRAYENVMAQDPPDAMAVQTLYALGQLSFVTENYDDAVKYLRQWFERAENPGPEPYVLLCQGIYQQGTSREGAAAKEKYREAIEPCQTAVRLARERGKPVRENWWLLLRTFYYELGEFDNMLEVLEELLVAYPKKEYWLQLSGVYGELEQERNQLAAYEVAYRQGFLTRGSELITLSQLLMQAQVPYRGAKILEEGIEAGLVESDLKNNRLLAQAWMLAAEDERAIQPLTRAASQSSDGELDYRLAQTYFNLDRNEDAVEALERALEKGGLRREDSVQVLLGMSLYNLERYDDAKAAFRAARGDSRSRKLANQWISHVTQEQEREAQLAQALRGR